MNLKRTTLGIVTLAGPLLMGLPSLAEGAKDRAIPEEAMQDTYSGSGNTLPPPPQAPSGSASAAEEKRPRPRQSEESSHRNR